MRAGTRSGVWPTDSIYGDYSSHMEIKIDCPTSEWLLPITQANAPATGRQEPQEMPSGPKQGRPRVSRKRNAPLAPSRPPVSRKNAPWPQSRPPVSRRMPPGPNRPPARTTDIVSPASERAPDDNGRRRPAPGGRAKRNAAEPHGGNRRGCSPHGQGTGRWGRREWQCLDESMLDPDRLGGHPGSSGSWRALGCAAGFPAGC